MNVLTSINFFKVKDIIPKQEISESWHDRNRILNKDVNLFCWKRSPIDSISDYLNGILNKNPKPIVFTTSVLNLSEDLQRERQKWDIEFSEGSDAFWKDIYALANDFLKFSDTGIGSVHLKIIDNNACTKFHTDRYSLRLFTTYIGKGTEWLPENATNRKGLGRTNADVVKDFTQVNRMEAFEVGILKGEISNKPGELKGIVHRSPEIETAGEKRIILRVDI